MNRFSVCACAASLAAIASAVFAGDPATPAAPVVPAASGWDEFARRFDLDANGRVTWDEYQKVVSGFAALDRDHDGVVTKEEFATSPASGSFAYVGPRAGPTPWAAPVWTGTPGTGGGDGTCVGSVCVGGNCKGGASGTVAEMAPWIAVGMLGDAVDADRDETISKAEWDAFAAKLLPEPGSVASPATLREIAPDATPPGAETMWTTLLDRDGNGRIERADLDAVFAAVDSNKDGRIDREDAPPGALKGAAPGGTPR